MRNRGIAVVAAAALLIVAGGTPASAQSCDEFATQKEAQQTLEQVGDTAGLLDPDANGLACDDGASTTIAAQETDAGTDGTDVAAPTGDDAVPEVIESVGPDRVLSSGTAINEDGPVTSDNAAGDSGVTMQISTDDGTTAEIGAEPVTPVNEPVASDDGETSMAAAGDAVAVDDPNGERAQAGEALAIDDQAPVDVKPKPEKVTAAEEPVVAAPVTEVPAAEAPIALPKTGVGSTSPNDRGWIIGLLAAGLVLGAGWAVRQDARSA